MPKTKSKKLTWEEKISKQLVGRKIVEVRWMTKEEADERQKQQGDVIDIETFRKK